MTRTTLSRVVLNAALCVSLSVAACAGSKPAADATTASPTGSATTNAPVGPATAAPAGTSWNAMDHGQRLAYMKSTVTPQMKASFQAFDAKGFASFSCGTCHGDGAKNGTFKMPNPQLPKLDPTDGFKKHMDKTPDITKYMMAKVVPQMSSLLGVQAYDPATHQGFGCFNCHVMDK